MPSSYNQKESIDRREFIRRCMYLGGAAAGVGVWGYLAYSREPVRESKQDIRIIKDFRADVSSVYPILAVARGREAERMVRSAVDRIGGIGRFVRPGESVLVKPNAAWDRQPEQGANTSPEIVAAVVKLCREARASKVIVSDVCINDPYRVFARSGIEKAVLSAGGNIVFPSEGDFVDTDMRGELLAVWPVFSPIHQADRVINVPALKHHSLSRCTLSMKNWYGILGGRRNQLHQEIHTSIADLAAAVRPTLTIMDATRVLKRNGPTGGNPADVVRENTVIVGTDEVAIDTYSLRYLDLRVEDVPYLSIAEKRGIGTTRLIDAHIAEIQVG